MANVGVIGDTHEPFCHKHYLDFCYQTLKKCDVIVHIGDLVDNHALSYHEHDPNGLAAKAEIEAAQKKIKPWIKAFPEVKLCKGNHDVLVSRKAITHGIPEICLRSYKQIWNLPAKWQYEWNYQIDQVRYEHGTGYSGQTGHIKAAYINMQSTVIGHLHSVAGVDWFANDHNLIFGMSVGCGIDRKQYAFWYGKDFIRKPILGCGLVIDKVGQFIPMSL